MSDDCIDELSRWTVPFLGLLRCTIRSYTTIWEGLVCKYRTAEIYLYHWNTEKEVKELLVQYWNWNWSAASHSGYWSQECLLFFPSRGRISMSLTLLKCHSNNGRGYLKIEIERDCYFLGLMSLMKYFTSLFWNSKLNLL